MKVTLVSHNTDALELLIFAKGTRLKMSPTLFTEIDSWTEDEKIEEAKYIANTIRSSWEFLDYTFLIEGVSRAFTHQFVRNRQGSYAQQTMRMLDVSDFAYITGPSLQGDDQASELYHDIMATINASYQDLLGLGIPAEDARGILPTNICTNIMAKYNLRTLAELVASRASPRTQGEFREVMAAMYDCVIEVHPWAELFLNDPKARAAKAMDKFIYDNASYDEDAINATKMLDILRK